MKKYFFLPLLILCLSFNLDTDMDCNPYLVPEEGAKWELTSYNGRGKVESISKMEMLEITTDGNNITYRLKSEFSDPKGKETMSSEFEAQCIDGVYKIDILDMMSPEIIKQYEDMGMEMEVTGGDFPSFNDRIGTKLEDNIVTMSASNTGMGMLNMKVVTTDRLLAAKEKITTPAGTFDCILITSTVRVESIMNVESQSKEWYAPNVGMVRSESSRKGKLDSYTELTSLTR